MNVWKYCDGYVKITVSGKNLERFVNRAVTEGILLSNVKRDRGGALTADISMRGLRRLRITARGCGCKVKILSKHGLPRLLIALKRNLALCVFAAVAVAALILCSTRVWSISVDAAGLDEAEVYETLSLMGIKRGVSRSVVVPSEIGDGLVSANPNIAHAQVTLTGVVLSISITQTRGTPLQEGDTAPASVYADKDCVIHSVSVSRGRAAVKAGDAVLAGQLLINGDLSSVKEGYFVNAEGEITGRVLYRITADADRYAKTQVRSGVSSKVASVAAFGTELLPEMPYKSYELELTATDTINACGVPVIINSYICHELVESYVDDGEEAAEKRAMLAAQEKLTAVIPTDAHIIALRHECVWNADGTVTAMITIETMENIGLKRYI